MEMGLFARIQIDPLVAFVFRRYSQDGGFSTIPNLPATIEDTFYATDLLVMLERLNSGLQLCSRVDPDRLSSFIRRKYDEEKSRLPLRLRYYLLKIGINVLGTRAVPLDNYFHTGRPTYENLFYQEQLGQLPEEKKQHIPRPDLDHCTCRDVYYYTVLFPEPEPLQIETVSGWLRACQNGDGGFGFFPGTTSFLENSYYCLSALSLLKACPADPARAEQFVVSCQTGAGGFARSIVGAPFLEFSRQAIRLALCTAGVFPS